MDYRKFYAEIADWISQVNQKAVAHGMQSPEFWDWVTSSADAFNKRYNNPLVYKQMIMLCDWLHDIYESGRKNE